MNRIFPYLLVLLCWSACDESTEKAEKLLKRSADVQSRICQLKLKTDSIWSQVSLALDDQLPGTMQPEERKNMIAVKNADLIRMFKVYPQLDPSIHSMVDGAAETDALLASEFKNLKAEKDQLSRELAAILEKLDQSDAPKAAMIRERLQAIDADLCD